MARQQGFVLGLDRDDHWLPYSSEQAHVSPSTLPCWQADGKLPKDQQRGYRGVFHALYRIARDEGVLTYWRGGGTTGEPAASSVI